MLTVLATVKDSKGRRSIQSKAGRAFSNLALPAEERKLRTAYKANPYGIDSVSIGVGNVSFVHRNSGMVN